MARYTKVKKTILSATNFGNTYTKTQNLDIDKDGQEYTPIVANYFKVVEILLYRKIKDKVTHINQKGIEISNAYTVKGLVHDFNSNTDDSLTLGEMAKF